MNYLNYELEHVKYGKGIVISKGYEEPYSRDERMYQVYFFDSRSSINLNIDQGIGSNQIKLALFDKHDRLKKGYRSDYDIEFRFKDYYYQWNKFRSNRNELSETIIALKYKQGVELYKAEKEVGEILYEMLPDNCVICVVPSSTAGKRTFLEKALDGIADNKGIRVLNCFERIKDRKPNNSGGRRDPLEIRRGIIVKNQHTIKGRDIILLDDICTSGSTFKAFGDLLYEHGAKKVEYVSLGSTIEMNEYNREKQLFALLRVPGLGRKTLFNIIQNNPEVISNDYSIIESVLKTYAKKYSRIKIPTQDEYCKNIEMAERVFAIHREKDIDVVSIGSPYYPKQFYLIDTPPILLYGKGNLNLLTSEDYVAIIGSRSVTEHGARVAKRLGTVFAEIDEIVVSGLAIGCDTFAHIGCLEAEGKTVAILPSPIDDVMPKGNEKLSEEIVDGGGLLLSEYYSGQKITNAFYADRDRLQSGLSNGVIVVETTSNGGTMITVGKALKYGKAVGCYVHPSKYAENDHLDGNRKLLNSKDTVPIDSLDAIELFVRRMQTVKANINKSVNESATEQLSFAK